MNSVEGDNHCVAAEKEVSVVTVGQRMAAAAESMSGVPSEKTARAGVDVDANVIRPAAWDQQYQASEY